MIQIAIRRRVIIGTILFLVLAVVLGLTWTQSRAQGGEIRYGETVNGSLKQGGSEDWRFVGSAEDVVAISIERASGDLSPILAVFDPAGRPVAGTQAPKGGGLAALMQVRLTQPGSFLIHVTGNEQTSGDYNLTLTLTTPAPITPTIAPTFATALIAGTISTGEASTGEITSTVFRQQWIYHGVSGSIVDIRMRGVSGDLVPYLGLVSPAGDVLVSNDSPDTGLEAGILAYMMPFTGDYTIIARRAGSGLGRDGTTTGRYELLVTIRGPGTAAQNTILNIGDPIRGRVTDNVPLGVYRLDLGGSVAVRLDLGNLHRMARVRFLSITDAVVGDYSGLSPLTIAIDLPNKVPFLVEVSITDFDNITFTDYDLLAYRLSADVTSAQPVEFGQPRRATAGGGLFGPENWFFLGKVGDIVRLNVNPGLAAIRTSVKLTGPQDLFLYQGTLGTGLSQTFTLPADGVYEVEVRAAGGEPTIIYDLQVDRIGAKGIPFAQFAAAEDRGALSVNGTTQNILKPGTSDSWWLDGNAGQTITLTALPAANGGFIGLALQRPDGSLVDVQLSERLKGAVIQNASLDQAGRYRIIAFDGRTPETQTNDIPYVISYEDVGGGRILPGKPVKGVVTPSNGIGVWSLEAAAGSLINSRLVTSTPNSWTPSLWVVDPNGAVITTAAVTSNTNGTTADLLGVTAPVSGVYKLVVAGPLTGSFASYSLLTSVQIPFSGGTGTPIEVSTTQIPIGGYVDRYTAVKSSDPIQNHVANLINPAVSADSVLNSDAQILIAGSTVRGEIASGAIMQSWRFSGVTNASMLIHATALTGTVGPDLVLYNKDGKIVCEAFHAEDPTTTLSCRIGPSGFYFIAVQLGLKGGRYTLSLDSVDVIDGPLLIADGIPIIYGQTLPGEITGPGKSDTYYFLGAINDLISIQMIRVAGNFAPQVELFSPTGKPVGRDPDAKLTDSLARVRLPLSGLYKIVTHAGGDNPVGRYSLYLDVVGGARLTNRGGGIITPGQTTTGFINIENTEDTWLFQGHAGERVSFVASGLGDPSPAPLGLRLQDTAGQIFAAQDALLSENAVRLNDIMLPADAVYRVQVVGGRQFPGVYSLTWLPETSRLVVGPLSYGQSVSGVFTPSHSGDTWVFSGTAGDVISVALRYQRGDKFSAGFQLRAENGVALATAFDNGDGSGARVDGIVLPFNGSFSIVLANPTQDFKGAGVYGLSVNLQDSKARSIGGVLRYGDKSIGDLYVDDPVDTWVFSARGGDVISLSAQGRDQFLRPAVELRTPGGAVLTSALPDEKGQTTIDKFPIPADGVYVISVSGAPGLASKTVTTGSYSLTLDYTPPPPDIAEKMGYGDKDNDKEGLIANDRPRETRTFAGRQGDRVTISMARESGSALAPVVELHSVDGALLARADSNGGDAAVIKDFVLPLTGQYTIISTRYLSFSGQTAGRYKIHITGASNDLAITALVKYGEVIDGRLNDEAPVNRYRFTGKQGEVVGVITHATSGNLDTRLTLEGPNGDVIAANDDTTDVNATIGGVLLPTEGTYTIVLARAAFGSVGNYELSVNLLYKTDATAAPQALVTYGQRVYGMVDQTNDIARYTFSGNRDDEISVLLLHQTDDAPPLLSIQDPAGTVLANGTLGLGQTRVDRYRLPTDGLYIIAVKRPSDSKLAFTPFALRVDLLSSPVERVGTTGGVLNLNTEASQAITGTFSPGQSAQYWLFEGKSGQAVSVSLIHLTGDLAPSMILIGPGGGSLASAVVPEGGASVSINHLSLPANGVYTVLVLPGGNRIGQYRLSVQLETFSAITTETLTAGRTVNGTLDALHTDGRWTFEGKQGQVITAQALVTSGDLIPRLQLIGTGGNIIADGTLQQNPQGIFNTITSFTLPDSGNFVLVVGRTRGAAGTYRLSLEIGALSPQTGATPLVYGQSVNGILHTGTPDLWTFIGAAGDTVTLAALINSDAGQFPSTGGTPLQAPTIELQDLNGRVLLKASPSPENETYVQGYTIPATGRYVVALSAPASVAYTFVVQRRQSLLPPSGTSPRALVVDTPLKNGILSPEAVDYWSFNAKAGTVIQIAGTRLDSDLRIDMALFGPTGYITSATAPQSGPKTLVGPVRLAEDGTYLLVVTHWLGPLGKTAGSYSLVLSFPSDVSGSNGGEISAYGQTVTGGITDNDAKDTWTLDGQAGDVVTLHMARLDGDLTPSLKVVAPDGKTEIASADGKSADVLIENITLAASGKYTILVGRVGQTTGGYKLTVDRPQTVIQSSIPRAEGIGYGEEKSGNLTQTDPSQAWLFFGKAADRITIDVKPDSGSSLDPSIVLLAPDGSSLITATASGANAQLVGYSLPTDGFYAIVVGPNPTADDGKRVGKYSVSLQRDQPGSAYQGQLAIGGSADGLLTSEQPVQAWVFDAKGGQTIAATVSSSSMIFQAVVSIVMPDGRVLGSSSQMDRGANSIEAALPGPGRYVIVISAAQNGIEGPYKVSLAYALAPTGGGVLIDDETVNGSVSDTDFSDSWRLTLGAGDSVSVSATRLSGDLDLEIALYAPDGTLIVAGDANGATAAVIPTQAITVPGDYVLIVTRKGSATGKTSGTYQLQVKHGGAG